MRSQQWIDGRRNGIKFAVSWLRDRAYRMHDEHARQVLYSASFNLGNDAKTSICSEQEDTELRDVGAPHAAPEAQAVAVTPPKPGPAASFLPAGPGKRGSAR